MQRLLFFFLSFHLLSNALTAQKIKYDKRIFPLVETGNYDYAEPLLKTFLSNEKNDDHANAHLHMGILYQKKIEGISLLEDTSRLFMVIDSALFYFDKAYSFIDNKEIRKNDEFYQSYVKRDLRTGDYGIKLSDIHLDIETSQSALKELRKNTRGLYQSIKNAEDVYREMKSVFSVLDEKFESENAFYLMAGEPEQSRLDTLMLLETQLHNYLRQVAGSAGALSLESVDEDPNPVGFDEFKMGNILESNFSEGKLSYTALGTWAQKTKTYLASTINKLRSDMIKFDQKLKDLLGQAEEGKRVYPPEVVAADLLQALEEVDPDAIPARLMKARVAEINYRVVNNPGLNIQLQDSFNVYGQYAHWRDQMQTLDKLSDYYANISQADIDDSYRKHTTYYSALYGYDSDLRAYIRNQNNWVKEQRVLVEKRLAYWEKANNWALLYDSAAYSMINTMRNKDTVRINIDSLYALADSIPLKVGSTSMNKESAVVKTLTKEALNDGTCTITGVIFDGNVGSGFIASVPPERMIDEVDTFQLDELKIDEGRLNKLVGDTARILPNERLLTYFFYEDDMVSADHNFLLVLLESNKTIIWASSARLEEKPYQFKNDQLLGQIMILFSPPEGAIDPENVAIVTYDGEIQVPE